MDGCSCPGGDSCGGFGPCGYETKLVLCGKPPAPEYDSWEPCALESGHEGDCAFWSQWRPAVAHRQRPLRNAVWILQGGEIVLHFDIAGAVQAEEVCAMLAISDVMREKMQQREGA